MSDKARIKKYEISDWIPSAERLPEPGVEVFVTHLNFIHGSRFTGTAYHDGRVWQGVSPTAVIAWMPMDLPEPYEGE